MTKKTITTVIALALGALVFARTPQEMAIAKDWKAFSMCDIESITNYMPKANAIDVYEMCLATNVNYWKAAYLVNCGYVEVTQEKCYNYFKSKWPDELAFDAAWMVADNSKTSSWQLDIAESGLKAGTVKSQNFLLSVLIANGKLKSDEAEFLRIASDALAKGDFITASAPIYCWPTLDRNYKTDETETLKKWRDDNADAIMTGLASMELTDAVASCWRQCIYNLFKRDQVANDRSSTYAMRFFNAKFFDAKFGGLSHYYPSWAFCAAQIEAFVKNSTDVKAVYDELMKNIYPRNRVYCIEIFKKNFEKFATNPNIAFKVALEINDVSKMIDALVASTNDLGAEDISKVIEKIVVLDADYRTADVVKILKNINAKYTLKLYDDRDTWEPILSKVRALIDTRL